MAIVAGKKPPDSMPYSARRRDGVLSPTAECSIRYWLDSFARAKFSLLLKTHDPSKRELADKTTNSTLDEWIHRQRRALSDNHPRRKSKVLRLDTAIVNPCASFNLENAARHTGKHLADAVEWMKNKYRGSFPASYSLFPLSMSTCGEVGSDAHAFIKELAIRLVEQRSYMHSKESQHL